MAHIHEKIDFTAEVFIVHNNKVLLRKHDKYKIWLSIGGHIELDEDPVEAAIREVKEEVGLEVEIYCPEQIKKRISKENQDEFKHLIPPQSMYRHNINETHEHVTLVYYASSSTAEFLIPEHEQTEGCRWFTKEELQDPQYNLRENIKYDATQALELLNDKRD